MAIGLEPVVGAWYINLNSQFLKVLGTVYELGERRGVVLSYLKGSRVVVSLDEWYKLDLLRYPQETARRSGITQF